MNVLRKFAKRLLAIDSRCFDTTLFRFGIIVTKYLIIDNLVSKNIAKFTKTSIYQQRSILPQTILPKVPFFFCLNYTCLPVHFRTSTNGEDTKKLTVVFYAILSDKFDFDDKSKIVIRGQEPVFLGWNKGGVPLKTEK